MKVKKKILSRRCDNWTECLRFVCKINLLETRLNAEKKRNVKRRKEMSN